MTKGARGEALLTVGEQEYPILFTNRALAEAEQRTGKSILLLAREAGNGILGVGETAMLLLTGMETGRKDAKLPGKRYEAKDAYDLLDQAGFAAVAAAVYEAIAAVLAYDPEEGEEEDGEERPPQ